MTSLLTAIHYGSTYINTCGAKPNEAELCDNQWQSIIKEDSICLFSVAKEAALNPSAPNLTSIAKQ